MMIASIYTNYVITPIAQIEGNTYWLKPTTNYQNKNNMNPSWEKNSKEVRCLFFKCVQQTNTISLVLFPFCLLPKKELPHLDTISGKFHYKSLKGLFHITKLNLKRCLSVNQNKSWITFSNHTQLNYMTAILFGKYLRAKTLPGKHGYLLLGYESV